MGLLSAAMLAETQKINPTLYAFVDVAFPSGTRRYSAAPLNVGGTGVYQGRVTRWSQNLTRAISDRDGNLGQPRLAAVVADSDDALQPIIEAGDARNSSVVVTIASPNVAKAGWFTYFNGLLANWRMNAGGGQDTPIEWELLFSFREQPLRGKINRLSFMTSDWPNLLSSVQGQFAPIIYGVHDSTNSTQAGMVPTFLVDTTAAAPKYAVSQGWLFSVDRVFADGSQITSGVGGWTFTVNHPTKNGRTWTTIEFSAVPASWKTTTVITADVQGYETTGFGTGSLLKGSDQLQHLLENFVFGDYQGGGWVAPTNTSASYFSTSSTYTRQVNLLTARWIGGKTQSTGLAEIAGFCRTTQMFAFWTNGGLIGLLPLDLRDTTVYYDAPRWVNEQRADVVGKFNVDFNRDNVVDRFSVSYLYSAAAGAYQRQLEVRNLSLSENTADTLEMTWSQAA